MTLFDQFLSLAVPKLTETVHSYNEIEAYFKIPIALDSYSRWQSEHGQVYELPV